jgi:hypothetical protein
MFPRQYIRSASMDYGTTVISSAENDVLFNRLFALCCEKEIVAPGLKTGYTMAEIVVITGLLLL